MLLVPLYRPVDWRRPPVVTILLILVNVFVYFGIQGRDEARHDEAQAFYLQSPLPGIEFPAYVQYLKQEERLAEAKRVERFAARKDEARVVAVYALQSDAEFLRRLRAGEIVTPQHPSYAEWRDARERYEALLGRVTSRNYGFVPAEHRPATFLTHMFLHGSVGHLLGNMLFLFLVGFSVEAILGRARFLGLYLLSGLGAVGLFWAAHASSVVPLVGASGAIAGLMGLYTALFGLRRINFFCFVFVYFNFFKAPAILLLPLWLANELYQLFLGGPSNVAYEAHIGGLVSGALLGLAAKRWLPGLDLAYMDRAAQEEQQQADMEAGMKLIGELKLEPARKIFERLLAQQPDNRSVLRQLYHIAKFQPQSAAYHAYAKRLLALAGNDAATQKLVRETFEDYVRHARPPRLTGDELAGLAMRFARGGQLDPAEKIVRLLMKRSDVLARVPGCLLALADACRRANRPEASQAYLESLIAAHPQSVEAQEARQRLAVAARQRAPG